MPMSRQWMRIGMGNVEASMVEELLERLECGDWFARNDAARALGELGDPRAVPALCRCLEGPAADEKAGTQAAEALGKIGDPAAVPALCGALKHRQPWVRAEAARALERIADPAAVEPLCSALGDRETLVIWRAAEALAAIGEPAVGPLVRTSEEIRAQAAGNASSGATGTMALGRAAMALGKIGDPAACEVLLRVLDHDSEWVQGCAAEALGRIGDPRALERLVPLLSSASGPLRTAAALALARLEDPRSLPGVLELLTHRETPLRLAAAEALAALGHPGALSALRRRVLPVVGERDPAVLAALRQTLSVLEATAARVADRPIPAAAPPVCVENLPLAGHGSAPTPEALPLPHRGETPGGV